MTLHTFFFSPQWNITSENSVFWSNIVKEINLFTCLFFLSINAQNMSIRNLHFKVWETLIFRRLTQISRDLYLHNRNHMLLRFLHIILKENQNSTLTLQNAKKTIKKQKNKRSCHSSLNISHLQGLHVIIALWMD